MTTYRTAPDTTPATAPDATPATVTRIHGLRVVLHPLPWAHSAAACLSVECGSRDDLPAPPGTAHLAEHVQIAATRRPGEARTPILAETGNARTVFRATTTPDNAADMAALLLRVLARYDCPATVLEAERAAVTLETARMDASPLLRAGGLLAAADPAGEPGSDAVARTLVTDVAAVTAADVRRLVGLGYHPGNAVLAVAGPPASLAGLTDAVADLVPHRPAPPPARPAPRTGQPLTLPALDGLVAVTHARPRTARYPGVDALLGESGPVVAAAAALGVPLLGRTTIDNSGRAVDVWCWRPERAQAGRLAARLREVCEAMGGRMPADAVARAEARTLNQRAFDTCTPLGRATAAATEQGPAPATAAPGPLHLWTIRDGRPRPAGVPVPVGG